MLQQQWPAVIGTFGFVLSCVFFLALGILLLTTWRGRLQGGLLLLAVFASALWAAIVGTQVSGVVTPYSLSWAAEALRLLVWCLFMMHLLRMLRPQDANAFWWVRWGLILGMLMFLPIEEIGKHLGLGGEGPMTFRLLAHLLLTVLGLSLIEQLYRNTPWQHRWGIKFLCFGLGAVFVFEFYVFSDALLFQRIDHDLWIVRGAVSALVVPLLALSVSRNPKWSFDLSLSRALVAYSTTVVAAGVYLVFMALAGYYIRFYGGDWGRVFQPVFLFGAALLLAVLLFSGQVRSHIRGFINEHLFLDRYDYRAEWLRLISVLSGKVLNAPLAERVVFALTGLVDSPGGALWAIGPDDNCTLEAVWGIPHGSVPSDWDANAFCGELGQAPFVIELSRHPGTESGAPGLVGIPQWMLENNALWLLVPMMHESRLQGFVVVSRPRAEHPLDDETRQLLLVAARQAASYLALEQAADALAQARQFDGFNRLSAFVVHDLKNLVAQLTLVTRNADRLRGNPEFVDDAFKTVRDSVDRMQRLLAQLRGAVTVDPADRVKLGEAVQEAVQRCASTDPVPTLQLEGGAELAIKAEADRLVSILVNVVRNAQEATSKGGRVDVRLRVVTEVGAKHVLIEVVDDGCGMTEEFLRRRLFRPFESTKGLAGMGIGAFECQQYVGALGGRVLVESEPGRGTRFKILLPMQPDPASGLGEAIVV